MNPKDGILRSGCLYGKNFFICQTTGKTVKGILQEKGTWKVKIETAEGHPKYYPLVCPWESTHTLEVKHCGSQETLACKGCGGLWLAIIEENGTLKYCPKSVTVNYTEEGEIPILNNEQANFTKGTHIDMVPETQSRPRLVVDRESARQKMQTQIDSAYQLRAQPIYSEDVLEKVIAECREWSDNNRTLLRSLFSDSSIADQYSGFSYQRPISSTNPLVNPSLKEQVDRYQERITASINSLEGLCDQLDLFDESSDDRRDKNRNNMAYVIFSKRQHTSLSETIPKNLRVQIFHIWGKIWETPYDNNFGELQVSQLAYDAYKSIEATLCEEYGVFDLDGGDVPNEDGCGCYRAVRKFLLETEDTAKVIDVIEVSFRYIDKVIRDISHDGISSEEAIDLLNQRFREHNVGYQYESGENEFGQIVKVDSPDSHSEVVKPAEELPKNTQQPTNQNTMNNENKKIFIGHGHSEVWRVLKDFIVETLGLEYEEFNRISPAGKSNKERLKEMLEACCMAFLIMTGEDEQADGSFSARDNVIHEAGLFQGKLSFEKAIVLLEDGCQEFSNIEGLGQIRFPKGNIRAAFEDIRDILKRESMI